MTGVCVGWATRQHCSAPAGLSLWRWGNFSLTRPSSPLTADVLLEGSIDILPHPPCAQHHVREGGQAQGRLPW